MTEVETRTDFVQRPAAVNFETAFDFPEVDCLFSDGFMLSGHYCFFTSNWMQKTSSVFLLLGPA